MRWLALVFFLGDISALHDSSGFDDSNAVGGVVFDTEMSDCGAVNGEVPYECGGTGLEGDGELLGCGTYGLTVRLGSPSGTEFVAKLLQTPASDDEDELAEEKAKSANECAVMKLLQSQRAPNVLRCKAECTGKLFMEINEEAGTVDTPVMLTAPVVHNFSHFIDRLGTPEAIQTAYRQTVYTGAYMLAAGVVNSDMDRNIIYASDGTTTFIDLGLAAVVTEKEDTTWEELKLTDFGFVQSEMLFRVPLSAAQSQLRKHLDAVISKSEQLGWPDIEETWRSAWDDAEKQCTYKVSGLRELADQTLHGLRLLRAVTVTDPHTARADSEMVTEALKAGGALPGAIWESFKAEALEQAMSYAELAEVFDNLEGYSEVATLLS